MIKTALLLLFAVMLSVIDGYATDLIGTVKDTSGKPLAQVFIYSKYTGKTGDTETFKHESTKTDANGFFRLHNHGRVVFFKRDGLRPIARVITGSTDQIEVILEESERTEWVLISCNNNVTYNELFDHKVQFSVPSEAIIERGSSVDARHMMIKFIDKSSTYWLSIWLMTTFGFPPEENILNSIELKSRAVKRGQQQGVEMRGSTYNGKHWRYISIGLETIFYDDASDDAAAYFDKMIDSLCEKP